MNSLPHLRTSDLPGWPCPPRVRDMVKTPDSWGYVLLGSLQHIVQDDGGYLWADGDVCPRPMVDQVGTAHQALLMWTEQGLAVFIPVGGYGNIVSKSLLGAEPERWIPIRTHLNVIPEHVKNFGKP